MEIAYLFPLGIDFHLSLTFQKSEKVLLGFLNFYTFDLGTMTCELICSYL